jgi:hypothetical protein
MALQKTFSGIKFSGIGVSGEIEEAAISVDSIRSLRDRHGVSEIPNSFFEDLELFGRRNATYFRVGSSGRRFGIVCLRCLKAYALNKANDLGISGREFSFLFRGIKCECGHGDYFMDRGKVKKVDVGFDMHI